MPRNIMTIKLLVGIAIMKVNQMIRM